MYNLKDLFNFNSIAVSEDKTHALYRTGTLDEADSNILKYILTEFNIGYYFDLRNEYEINQDSSFHIFIKKTDIVYYNFPIQYQGFDISKIKYPCSDDYFKYYLSILKLCKDAANLIYSTYKDTRHSILFGCNAGKDRTGIVAALIQQYCGLDEDIIFENYRVGTQLSDSIIKRIWGDEGSIRYKNSFHNGVSPIQKLLLINSEI